MHAYQDIADLSTLALSTMLVLAMTSPRRDWIKAGPVHVLLDSGIHKADAIVYQGIAHLAMPSGVSIRPL